MIYDSKDHRPDGVDRVLVFASWRALQNLRENHHWSADATFQCCPRAFSQLFVIGFYIKHKMYPAAHALMTKKTNLQYVEVLRAIRNTVIGSLPESGN